MEQVINNLINAGFTMNESKVYLTLVELGESKTGKICERTGIPSSHIYQILDSLTKKGVIGFKIYKNAKVYHINSPNTLKAIFTTKKEELKKLEEGINLTIESLKKTPKNIETISDYKYFEGIKGVKSMWFEALSIMNSKSSLDAYTGDVESFEELTAFYLEEIHKIRIKKDIKSRMILPIGATKEAMLRKKRGKIEIKYLKKESGGEFVVHDNFVILQHTGKKEVVPRGFLIKDAVFAKTFKEMFENLWRAAKAS
jgi:sugar-specific transcriptional regulator TrmB